MKPPITGVHFMIDTFIAFIIGEKEDRFCEKIVDKFGGLEEMPDAFKSITLYERHARGKFIPHKCYNACGKLWIASFELFVKEMIERLHR
jgi:hypothetical protein